MHYVGDMTEPGVYDHVPIRLPSGDVVYAVEIGIFADDKPYLIAVTEPPKQNDLERQD